MNSTPTVAKLKSPSDIVKVVPLLVGFHPEESLVAICLHGPRKRSGLTFRIDLPPATHEGTFAAHVADSAERAGADGVTVIVYTEASNNDGDQLPRAQLIDATMNELTSRGIGYLEVLLVRDRRWFSYDCIDTCCPRDGTPVPTKSDGDIAAAEARGALEGKAVLGSRAELEASVRAPVALRKIALEQKFERIGGDVIDRIHAGRLDDVQHETVAMARTAFERYTAGDHTLSDDEAVRMLIGLEDRQVRDLLCTWALDEPCQELVIMLSDLARCAPDEYAAPICTALGAVAYQSGGGALASIAFERALRSDPTYQLALMLETMLQHQTPPTTVRQMFFDARAMLQHLEAPPGSQAA